MDRRIALWPPGSRCNLCPKRLQLELLSNAELSATWRKLKKALDKKGPDYMRQQVRAMGVVQGPGGGEEGGGRKAFPRTAEKCETMWKKCQNAKCFKM